ncbi:MAG: MFS transporter [Myxococcales bacterium]|nr:MFS transporter [Myxococcales bacterium]
MKELGLQPERVTHRPLTVMALMLAVFMSALEITVVSTAMPTVVGELSGVSLYAWVFTAYVVISTVGMPIAGKLADLYGRKPVMLTGIVVFLLGSAACGQSKTMTFLIAARAVQGLGGGAMQSMALTIVGDIFTVHERARMQGVIGAVWGLAGVVGPVLGGFIVHHFGWQWIFYLNLPFGILSALILSSVLHERVEPRDAKLDLLGATLLGATIVLVLLGARTSWTLGVAAVFAGLFVWVERRAAEPVLSVALLSRPLIAIATGLGMLIGASLMSMLSFVPLYIQGVLGGSPSDAGAAIAPMAIGWPLSSAIAGRLVGRIGYRPLVRTGLSVTALAAVGMALFLGPGASLLVPRVASGFFGVGLGLANTVTLIAVQGSVEFKERGVATTSTMLFRTIGGALAVGLLGEVLARALRRDPSLAADAATLLAGARFGTEVSATHRAELSGALAHGLTPVFWVIAGFSVTAFLVGLRFPKLALGSERERS